MSSRKRSSSRKGSKKPKSKKGKQSRKSRKRGRSASRKSNKKRGGGKQRPAGGAGPISRGMPRPSSRTIGQRARSGFYSGYVEGSTYVGAIRYGNPNGRFLDGADADHGTLLMNWTVCVGNGIPKVDKEVPYWHRYAVVKQVFRIEGVESTNIGGSYIMANDVDVSEPAPAGPEGYKAMSEKKYKVKGRWFDKNIIYNVPCTRSDRLTSGKDGMYFVDVYDTNDIRTALQSKVYLMVETPATNQGSGSAPDPDSIVAHVWLDYAVQFSQPKEKPQESSTSLPIMILGNQDSNATAADPLSVASGENIGYTYDPQFGETRLAFDVSSGAYTRITLPLSWQAAQLTIHAAVSTQTATASTNLHFDPEDSCTQLQDYDGNDLQFTSSWNGSSTAGSACSSVFVARLDDNIPMTVQVHWNNLNATHTLTSPMHFMAMPMANPSALSKRLLSKKAQVAAEVKKLELLTRNFVNTEGKQIKPSKQRKLELKEASDESSSDDDGDDDAKRVWPAGVPSHAGFQEHPGSLLARRRKGILKQIASGGAKAPASEVSLAPRAETKSDDGKLQQEPTPTLGKQGSDRKHESVPGPQGAVGSTDGCDGDESAWTKIPDELDRPVDCQKLPDKSQRPIERPQGAGVSEGAGAVAFDEQQFKLFGQFVQWFNFNRKEDGPAAKQKGEAESSAPAAAGGARSQ